MIGFNIRENFLVITKKAADAIRWLADDREMSGNDVRSIVIESLKHASFVTSLDGPTGPKTVVQATIFGRKCFLELVKGMDVSGNPRLAPDGKKTVIYLAFCNVTHSHGIIAKRWGLR